MAALGSKRMFFDETVLETGRLESFSNEDIKQADLFD